MIGTQGDCWIIFEASPNTSTDQSFSCGHFVFCQKYFWDLWPSHCKDKHILSREINIGDIRFIYPLDIMIYAYK